MKAALVAIAMCGAATAYAQPSNKDRANKRAAQAKQLFAAKNFAGAAHAFEDAYALDKDPAYLFNIAQAYKSGNACADASRYYKQFLAEAPDAPNRETVEDLVKEVDACAADQAAAKPPPPERRPPPPPPPPARSSRRTLAIALGAAGVASLAAGAFFAWDVGRLADLKSGLCGDFGKPGQPDCFWSDDKERREHAYDDRAFRAQIIAASAFSAGALAIASGVVLYMSGGRSEQPIAITPIRGGAIASFGLEF